MTYLSADNKAKRKTAQAVSIADPSTCDTVTCGACEEGYRNPANSPNYCHRCPKAREYTRDRNTCQTCEVVSKIMYYLFTTYVLISLTVDYY